MDNPAPPRYSLLAELKRRHVFRVVAGYAAVAFATLQLADVVIDPLGLPQWAMRALVVATIGGFPVAVALAWFFDITSAGVRRTSDVGDAAGARGLSRRALLAGAAASVVVAAGAYAVARPAALGPGDPLESVAVLPFVDMSSAGDQEYFSDGMTEELLNALAKVEGLRVASRTSAARFRGQDVDVRDVGRSLNVRAVFEGSVRRDGEQLRVTAQLIDAATGYHLWSEAFDAKLEDVFAVQERVAGEIVRRLGLESRAGDAQVNAATRDMAAYDHYLRGNYHLARRTPVDVRRALQDYSEALRIDPGFRKAMLRQAYAYAIWVDWGWPDPPASTGELIQRGEALARRALAREPDDAEGWLVRAYLRVVADPYDMAGAPELFERAVGLAPTDPEILHQYGQTLTALGRFAEARSAYHRALEADPLRSMTLVPMAAMDYYSRRFDRSMRWADSAVAVDPANPYARAHRAAERVTGGDVEGALEDVGVALDATQGHAVPVLGIAAVVHAAAGDTAGALDFAARAEEKAGERISPTEGFFLGMAWTHAGRKDRAMAELRRVEPRGAWLWFYMQTPELDPLREDRSFVEIVRQADPRTAASRANGPFIAGPLRQGAEDDNTPQPVQAGSP